jgi:hypothetical protein
VLTGIPVPPSPVQLAHLAKVQGVAAARRWWAATRARDPGAEVVTEAGLKEAAYALLADEAPWGALQLFRWNAEAHPGSVTVYDGLAEGFRGVGDSACVRRAYELVLQAAPTDSITPADVKKDVVAGARARLDTGGRSGSSHCARLSDTHRGP